MFGLLKLSSRVRALEDERATLKREFQALEMEWSQAFDQIKRMMQRVAKRAEIAEKGYEGFVFARQGQGGAMQATAAE